MVEEKQRYRRAMGLHYDQHDDRAPFVTARGAYLSADRIVDIAHRYGIPVVEDTALARALEKIDLDEEIPQELFESVAAVLAALDNEF